MNKVHNRYQIVSSEDMFQAKVKVDVASAMMPADFDTLVTKEILLKYRLVIEYRSWGIKDIAITVPEQSHTLYYETEDGEEKSVVVTLNNVEVEYEKGEYNSLQVSPSEIDLGSSTSNLKVMV